MGINVRLDIARCVCPEQLLDNPRMEYITKNTEKHLDFIDCEIKHNEYMIQLFQTHIENQRNLDRSLKKMKVIYKLVKTNIMDMEDLMRDLVGVNIYNEEEYNRYMKGFMRELEGWGSFLD